MKMLECSFDYITASKEEALFLPHQDRFSFVMLCHGENFKEELLFKKLDLHSEGRLKRAVELATDFKAKEGQHLHFSALSDKIAHIHLIGCDIASQEMKVAALGGAVIKALSKSLYSSESCVFIPQSLQEYVYEIAQGAVLKNYSFTHYQTKKKKTHPLRELHFLFSDQEGQDVEKFKAQLETQWEKEGKPLCEAVFLARDVVNEPANILTPETYMQRIQQLEEKGLEIEVLDRKRMEKEGFGALLGVAMGSDVPPYTVIMRHYGADDRKEAPLAFIGKGVTFDSGGISIKPAVGMDEMKADMGGSAAVIGLMSALAGRKARVNAIGVVGLVENMVSGRAQRPGDIVTSHSGQTIEILNTDAEGRLVLADLLSYTKQTYQPKFMINLATLTGAIIVALGTEHAGLFSNDDMLAEALLKAGEKIDETLWRMPLGEAYNRQLNSDIADMKNIGGRPGSSILAAEFLKRFVGETKWAHLDIAGTAWKNKASSFAPKGATGYGVRLLNAFVKEYEKKDFS